MMRKKVTIVLNEREPEKARSALVLEQRLSSAGIQAERLAVSNDVVDILLIRQPHILILDYVLGDVGTGLDVLEALKGLPAYQRPRVIFFTDEPSVQVAVETLRRGAEHYLEFTRPAAMDQLLDLCIELSKENRGEQQHLRVTLSLEECAGGSTQRKALTHRLKAWQPPFPGVFYLTGARGSGRESFVRAWCKSSEAFYHCRTINCLAYTDSFAELFDTLLHDRRYPATCFVFRETRHDDNELRPFLTKLITEEIPYFQHAIAVCADSEEEALRLGADCGAERFKLPSLSEAPEDLFVIARQLLSTAAAGRSLKAPVLDKSVLDWMKEQLWPGEITQLKAVIEDALAFTETGQEIGAAIIESKKFWEMDYSVFEPEPDVRPFALYQLYEQCQGSMRMVASRLGSTPAQLHRLLDSYRQLNSGELL